MKHLPPKISWFLIQPWLLGLFLVVTQVKFLWNTWRVWDLPDADGAYYFLLAQQWITHFDLPSAVWSPVYISFYGIFHWLFADPLLIYGVHRMVTLVIITALFFIVMRSLTPAFSAWLMTLYMMRVEIHLTNSYIIHSFVLIPLLLIYILVLKIPSRFLWKNTAIIVGMMLLAFTRPEFGIVLPITLVLLVVGDYFDGTLKRLSQQQQRIYGGFTLVALVLVLLSINVLFADESRSLSAFAQHYALGYTERTGSQENPWLEGFNLMNPIFDEPHSISEAARNNPTAFVEHLRHNLGLLVSRFLRAFKIMDAAWKIVAVGLLLSVIAAALKLLPQSRQVAKAVFKQHWKLMLVMAVLTLPTLISVVIIYPRNIYFIPLQVPFLLIAGCSIMVWMPQRAMQSAAWIVPIVAVVILLGYPQLFPGIEADVQRPLGDSIRVLRQAEHPAIYSLVAENEVYCFYLEGDCQYMALDALDLTAPAEQDIWFMLVHPRLDEILKTEIAAFVQAAEGDWLFEASSPIPFYYRSR
jgi:hypothetical protein